MKKILVVLVAAVLLCGCQNKKDDNVIRIGAILPLSGNSAILGEPKKQAFEIARDYYNSQGYNVEIVYEDSEGTPRKGVASLNKLLASNNIDYYYVDMTTIANSCVPIVNQRKILTFAGSAEPGITNQSEYLFRLFAGGDQEIDLMIDYLEKIDLPSIYVLHTNELYGINACQALTSKYNEIGGVVLGSDEYPMNNSDFKSQLIKSKESRADKILLLGYGNEYSVLLKQAQEMQIQPSKIVCNLGGSNKAISDLPVEFIEELVFIGPRFSYLLSRNKLTDKMRHFVDLFQTRYNTTPDFRAAYVYDTMSILLEAISNGTSSSIEENICNIKNFEGVSGYITFLPNGDSYTDLIVAKYNQNKLIECL